MPGDFENDDDFTPPQYTFRVAPSSLSVGRSDIGSADLSSSFTESLQNAAAVLDNRVLWPSALPPARSNPIERHYFDEEDAIQEYDGSLRGSSRGEREWKPDNLKKIKPKIRAITPSHKCKAAIIEIVSDLCMSYHNKFKRNLSYISELAAHEEGMLELLRLNENDDSVVFSVNDLYTYKQIQNEFKQITNGMPWGRGSYSLFFSLLEDEAKKKYDKNHKYKYYPRLKATIKYGDEELLNEILSITQLEKGSLIWK